MIVFIPATIAVHHLHFSTMATSAQVNNGMGGCSEVCVNRRIIHVTAEYAAAAEEVVAIDHGSDDEPIVSHSDMDRAVESNRSCCCRSCCCCPSTLDVDLCAVPTEIDPATGAFKERWSESLFREQVAPILLHSIGRWVCIALCLGTAGYLFTSAIQLKKPTSSYMQLLHEEHPLEVYEKTQQEWFNIGDGNSFDFPYRFVFGLEPIDNGDVFNPADLGTPVYKSIDFSSQDSQQYLLDLCSYIASWDWTPQTGNSLDTNACGMFYFKSWMEVSCADTNDDGYLNGPDRTTGSNCCDKSNLDFPYPTSLFNECMSEFSIHIGGTKQMNHGFFFDTNGNLKVILVEGSSTFMYSQTFDEADTYYKGLKAFYDAREDSLGVVPSGSGFQHTFATTEINFYAMQSAITQGATDSAMYSTIFALIVLILMTKRLVSSLLVAFHLACVVVCVLGVFVELGWTLGVIESVITALAVGLACDFAAHLAHSFNDEEPRPEEDETPLTFPRSLEELLLHLKLAKMKATGAIANLGVTISLGFLSTFLAGCCLLLTDLYFTQQFGIFMCCVMGFSLCFSFMYLMPLLASIGWVDRLLAHWTQVHVMEPFNKVINGVSGPDQKLPTDTADGEDPKFNKQTELVALASDEPTEF